MNRNLKAVVVGGGIAGIASALLLQKCGWKVSLIEAQPRLGGLLGSVQTDWGRTYDFGTHFVAETGISELDELLLTCVDEREWHRIQPLKPGTFLADRLNCESSCLDLRGLPSQIYQNALPELLRENGSEDSFQNLEEQLLHRFGPETCRHIFAPILRSFFGVPLKSLAPDSHGLVSLRRFIVETSEQTKEWKMNRGSTSGSGFIAPLKGNNCPPAIIRRSVELADGSAAWKNRCPVKVSRL